MVTTRFNHTLAAVLATILLCAFPVFAGQHRMVDDSDTVRLHGNTHPRILTEHPEGASDPALPMEHMVLSLSLDPGKEAKLHDLLASQQDPASPNYHSWLTPEQFGRQFGHTRDNVSAVTDWLTKHGFSVDEVSKSRTSITFSGTAARVRRAFHTAIHDFKTASGKIRHANIEDPSIPRGLTDLVTGVVSLHNFPRKAMNSGIQAAPQTTSPDYNSGSRHYLSPADFAAIYNVNALYAAGIDGTGQAIAIAGRTHPSSSNWTLFRSKMGLSILSPQVIINGSDPGDLGSGEDGEADLDVEWAGAVAKNASIKFVTSKSTNSTDGLDLSVQYIVNQNLAPVMSVSFGQCEADLGAAENLFYNNLWKQAAAQGITVFVASGDSGASGCDGGDASRGTVAGVNGLSSTPYNVAVGGTQFSDASGSYWNSSNGSNDLSALGYIPEAAWNESGNVAGGSGLWSTGGGASSVYAKPSWQVAPGVPNDGRRDVPDVSLTASGHDGYLMITGNGGLAVSGGTSASAPSFAGLMALVVQKTGQRQGNANLRFYQLASAQLGGPAVFHDIVSGNNSVPGVAGYSSNGGYDLATGLGSVDAFAMVNNWGVSASYTVSGTIYSGSAGLPGATVSVGSSTATTGTDGSYTISGLAAGGYTVTASRAGYSTYTGSLNLTANTNTLNFSLVAQPTYLVSGTVRAGSSTGAVLAGATVSLAGKTTTSGSTGTFSLSGISAGTYAMTVSLPGYATFSNSQLAISANQTVNVALAPSTPSTFTVSGTVQGANGGGALPGAVVSVGAKTATTDSKGAFSITGVAAGSFPLSIAAPGYTTINTSVKVTANLALSVTLAPNSFTVSGTVRSANGGAALPGAVVGVGAKTATTDSKGAFSISGLAAGSLPLSVAAPGYTTLTASLNVTSNLTVSVTLALVPATHTVTGTVASASGTGLLPGAVVTIGDKSATVASSGAYSISGISAGTKAVTVVKPGYVSYTGTAIVNGSQNLNFTLTPIRYTVSGKIQANGTPLAGAVISLAGKTATSDSTGAFSIAGVVPGTYTLSVAKTSCTTFTNASFTVTANQAIAVTLIQPTYAVSGVIKSLNTLVALPGAAFSCAGRTVTAGSDGTFSLTGLSAGNYSYTVTGPAAADPAYTAITGNLSVSNNISGQQYLLSQPVYRVTGVVSGPGGVGLLAGATVKIGNKSSVVTASGIYTISGLAPGTYPASVSKAGYTSYSKSAVTLVAIQTLNFSLMPTK